MRCQTSRESGCARALTARHLQAIGSAVPESAGYKLPQAERLLCYAVTPWTQSLPKCGLSSTWKNQAGVARQRVGHLVRIASRDGFPVTVEHEDHHVIMSLCGYADSESERTTNQNRHTRPALLLLPAGIFAPLSIADSCDSSC